jgi:hypothetical protein
VPGTVPSRPITPARRCGSVLRIQLEVKRRAFTETGLFKSSLYPGCDFGELVEWHLNISIIFHPQPANAVADIEKVVFSLGRAAKVYMQAMLPRVVQSRVRACFECVERILVVDRSRS